MDAESVGQLVAQLLPLDRVQRDIQLEEVQEIYGRAASDRIRKAIEKEVAVREGRVIGWDGENFTGIDDARIEAWAKAYPRIDIRNEISKARVHLLDHPGKVKSDFSRFLNTWFKKELQWSLKRGRATGRLTHGDLHQLFLNQHEATRICSKEEGLKKLEQKQFSARVFIDWLFDRCLTKYGSQFSARWAGLDLGAVKADWATAVSKLSRDELRAGIHRMSMEYTSFPPNLDEFVNLCRPRESIETLFMQAATLAARHQVDHTTAWPSAALYWAAQSFGMARLASCSYSDGKARFAGLYYDALRQHEEGTLPPMPQAVPRISTDVPRPKSEAGAAALKQARELLSKGRPLLSEASHVSR